MCVCKKPWWLKGCIFLLKMMIYQKNIKRFGNLIANLSMIKFFVRIKSYSDKAAHFHNKEMPKVGSNHIYLAKITINTVFKKDKKRCS